MIAKVVRSRQVKTHVQKSHVNIKIRREEQKYVDGKSRLKFEKYTQVIQKSSVKSREAVQFVAFSQHPNFELSFKGELEHFFVKCDKQN